MTGEEKTEDHMVEDQAEVLLKQLMHLKTYEMPETARMTRNKQNILREIRNTQSSRRMSFGDLLELNMPWLFAEPKYGIAALFIAFMGLQYAGIQTSTSSQSTGIYTSTTPDYASLGQPQATIATNRYPQLPGNRALFQNPGGDGSIVPASFQYRE